MPYNIITTATLADADKLMQNFYWIYQGDRLPYTTTATGTLTARDSAYNLGASTARWNNIYANNLTIYGSAASFSYLWNHISTVTLTVTSASIEFTGLTATGYTRYMLSIYYNASYTSKLFCVLNNDTTTFSNVPYYTNRIWGSYNTMSASTTLYKELPLSFLNNTISSVYFDMFIFSQANDLKFVDVYGYGSYLNTYSALSYDYFEACWRAWTTTLDTIKFYNTSGAMNPGTKISVWGKA